MTGSDAAAAIFLNTLADFMIIKTSATDLRANLIASTTYFTRDYHSHSHHTSDFPQRHLPLILGSRLWSHPRLSCYPTYNFFVTLKFLPSSSHPVLILVPTSTFHSIPFNYQSKPRLWKPSREYTWTSPNSLVNVVLLRLVWGGSPQVGVIHSPLTRTTWGLRSGAVLLGDMS